MIDIEQRIAGILARNMCRSCTPAAEVTQVLVSELGLTRESATHPVPVQDYDEDGNPLMHECLVDPTPKMHFEFVPMSRYVTEWVPE